MAEEQAPKTADDLPPQDAAGGASGDPAREGAGTSAELEALKRERDEHYDRYLRKVAEFDNYRRRVERERREQADRAVVSLLEDLLTIVDDFERALGVDAGETGAAYRKGVEMIHARLVDLLRKQGVTPIDALGQDFDPNLHEAVMQESSADHRDNEVIAVLRKGYTLNDRLLRPAAVKVARS